MNIGELSDDNLVVLESEARELMCRHLLNPEMLNYWNELMHEASGEVKRRTGEKDIKVIVPKISQQRGPLREKNRGSKFLTGS